MQDLLFFAYVSVPFVLGGILLFYGMRKKSRLSTADLKRFRSELASVERKTPTEVVVGCDKLLDHILAKLRYGGTLGEKLKAKPAVITPWLEDIWRLHKVRNRIVHELDRVDRVEEYAARYVEILLQVLTKLS